MHPRDSDGRYVDEVRRACRGRPRVPRRSRQSSRRVPTLPDMAREQHATALVAKSPNDRAHGARAHHVEAVGGFVEQDVLRVVHERASQRHLRALAMRSRPCADPRSRACRAGRAVPRFAARADRSRFLQCAEVVEMFTGGQTGIEAEAIRQHAEPACAACGVATASTSSTRTSPLSGFITA